MRLTLTLILFLLANVPAQAGGNCISKFECVDTCGWQNSPPNLRNPSILYRLFYEPDGNWSRWIPKSDPPLSCEEAYELYVWLRCGNAKDIPKNISADCYECKTPYTQYTQKNCCPNICPAEVSQETAKDLRSKKIKKTL
ncbi:MAG TPA: hypothetical protein VMW10_01800 [Alphaproteobacteria bacterium]|nr:hypothetical protein [Alphaproteobacteria bacterium]